MSPTARSTKFFQAANAFYLAEPASGSRMTPGRGFQWLCADDHTANTVAFLRWDRGGTPLIVVCNFSPIHRKGYYVGAPSPGPGPRCSTPTQRSSAAPAWEMPRPSKRSAPPVTTRSRPSPSTCPHVRDGVPLYPPQPGPKEKRPGRRNRRRSAPPGPGPAKLPPRKPRPANQRRRRPGHKPKTDQA